MDFTRAWSARVAQVVFVTYISYKYFFGVCMLTIVSVYFPCEEYLFADRTMQEVIDLKNPFEIYNRVRYLKYIFLLPILQFKKKPIAEAAIILNPFEFSR